MSKMANIKKDDTVKVIAGKDKGKTGKVIKVLSDKEKVVVENINVYKKHQKPTPGNQEGGIVEKSMPIHVSNVKPVCPKCSSATSFRRKELENGERVRFCKKCQETLD